MKPNYQCKEDEDLLNDYLTTYTYPECAASALWYELQGSTGLENDGINKISTGAEKFDFSEPGTLQLACQRLGDFYKTRCENIKGIGSAAVKVSKATIGGVEEIFGNTKI